MQSRKKESQSQIASIVSKVGIFPRKLRDKVTLLEKNKRSLKNENAEKLTRNGHSANISRCESYGKMKILNQFSLEESNQ